MIKLHRIAFRANTKSNPVYMYYVYTYSICDFPL